MPDTPSQYLAQGLYCSQPNQDTEQRWKETNTSRLDSLKENEEHSCSLITTVFSYRVGRAAIWTIAGALCDILLARGTMPTGLITTNKASTQNQKADKQILHRDFLLSKRDEQQ